MILETFHLDSELPSSPACGSNATEISHICALHEGVFLCLVQVIPTPVSGGQSLAGPPLQTGRWPGSLGLSSCSSGLDAVPEINHISVKSCNGPLFLLENTPGSSLESWGDRPCLLCSALHKIASSRWTSEMSKLLASDGKENPILVHEA